MTPKKGSHRISKRGAGIGLSEPVLTSKTANNTSDSNSSDQEFSSHDSKNWLKTLKAENKWVYRTKSEKDNIAIGKDRNKTLYGSALVVEKGSKPWEWKIVVPDKSDHTDLTKENKIIITEKSEIANSLKKLNSDFYIHNLGGNPFGSVTREDRSDMGIRKSNKEIIFRQDAAFAKFSFPNVRKDAQVIVLADDDFLGHYLSQNLAQTLNSDDKIIYNVESNQPDILKAILQQDASVDKYRHNYNKFIGGSWYVESQSEIGGTLTGALKNAHSVVDTFSKSFRNSSYSSFQSKYFQGTTGLNLSDQELTLMYKVLESEINQMIRLKATIQTESGLYDISTTFKNSFDNSDLNVRFKKLGERSLNIKNTDQTVLLLISKMGIQSIQAEKLIQRLASQNLLTYPRTEYQGISAKEDIDTQDLADTWISYNQNFASQRDQIVQGINRIRNDPTTTELPRSGIFVLNKTNYDPNTLEYKTLQEISKANILASLGEFEVKGKLEIVNKENETIGESEDEITVIAHSDEEIGKVINVDISKKQGLSDYELFDFISEEKMNLGTTSTRTNLTKRLINWGFLLKNNQDEYRLDDRAKIMTIASSLADPSLTNGDFHKWLLNERQFVMNHPNDYNAEKEKLYSKLETIVTKLKDHELHEKSIALFNSYSKQSNIDEQLKTELTNEEVDIIS